MLDTKLLILILLMASTVSAIAYVQPNLLQIGSYNVWDTPHYGWGGYFYGGISEIEEQLTKMKDDGWNAIRPYEAQPWRSGLHYTDQELDYLVDRAEELDIFVYLNLMMNYPPEYPEGNYIEGHEDEWIDFWITTGNRYKNRNHVIIEAVNELNCRSESIALNLYNTLLQRLREQDINLPVLFNFGQWSPGYMDIQALNDPINYYAIGRHYYGSGFVGNNYDNVHASSTPTDLDNFAQQNGIEADVRRHFEQGGSAHEVRQLGVPYCVTELGTSYYYSNQHVSGGYVMSEGGMAFVMKYLEYSLKHKANIILHRTGSHEDYHVYYELATEYFNENFWVPLSDQPIPDPTPDPTPDPDPTPTNQTTPPYTFETPDLASDLKLEAKDMEYMPLLIGVAVFFVLYMAGKKGKKS